LCCFLQLLVEEEDQGDFWQKLLASRYEEFATKENEEAMGKGRRTRSKLIRYSEIQQLEEDNLNVHVALGCRSLFLVSISLLENDIGSGR